MGILAVERRQGLLRDERAFVIRYGAPVRIVDAYAGRRLVVENRVIERVARRPRAVHEPLRQGAEEHDGRAAGALQADGHVLQPRVRQDAQLHVEVGNREAVGDIDGKLMRLGNDVRGGVGVVPRLLAGNLGPHRVAAGVGRGVGPGDDIGLAVESHRHVRIALVPHGDVVDSRLAGLR